MVLHPKLSWRTIGKPRSRCIEWRGWATARAWLVMNLSSPTPNRSYRAGVFVKVATWHQPGGHAVCRISFSHEAHVERLLQGLDAPTDSLTSTSTVIITTASRTRIKVVVTTHQGRAEATGDVRKNPDATMYICESRGGSTRSSGGSSAATQAASARRTGQILESGSEIRPWKGRSLLHGC